VVVKKVAASPPVRVEIRIAGKIRLASDCYDVTLTNNDDGTVAFTGSLKPRMITPPAPRPAESFGDDLRDGDKLITQVHSGRRDRETR
jgi:hypothetical protein